MKKKRVHLSQLLFPVGALFEPYREGVWLVRQPCVSLGDFVKETEHQLKTFFDGCCLDWNWSDEWRPWQLGACRIRFGVGSGEVFDPELQKEFTLLGLQADTFNSYFARTASCLFR